MLIRYCYERYYAMILIGNADAETSCVGANYDFGMLHMAFRSMFHFQNYFLVLLLTSSDQILTKGSLFISRFSDINSTENVRIYHAKNYVKARACNGGTKPKNMRIYVENIH